MKKAELILISLILMISAAFLLISQEESGDTVTIIVGGEKYAEVSLLENQEIYIADTNIVTIENGEVYMSSATCPDKLCINQGKISGSSEKIICLPNKVIVEVSKNSDIDMVVK